MCVSWFFIYILKTEYIVNQKLLQLFWKHYTITNTVHSETVKSNATFPPLLLWKYICSIFSTHSRAPIWHWKWSFLHPSPPILEATWPVPFLLPPKPDLLLKVAHSGQHQPVVCHSFSTAQSKLFPGMVKAIWYSHYLSLLCACPVLPERGLGVVGLLILWPHWTSTLLWPKRGHCGTALLFEPTLSSASCCLSVRNSGGCTRLSSSGRSS